MASAATDLLIGKVVGILESEASSIVGVRDQVDEIKQELISMKSVDAEKWFCTFPRNLVIKSLRYLMSSVGCAIWHRCGTGRRLSDAQAGIGVLFYRPWEVCNLFRVSMWDSGRQSWSCHVPEWARLP
ncbi:unnamed protein product [Prunus armeniaca]